MPATIATSAELDRTLRKNFSDCGIRVAPDAQMTAVIAAFTALGIDVSVEDTFLVLKQQGSVFHTAQALKGFAAKPENAQFFILQSGDPRKWDTAQKIEYLRTHSDADYRRLIQQGPITAGVGAMDINMARSDYARLSTQEKLAFIAEFGPAGVAQVMRKPK